MVRILVISQNEHLVGELGELLRGQGFYVDAAASDSGIEADEADLVILDENLAPDGGFETLRRIRMKSSVPLLMLLRGGSAEERIASLEAGADDCLAMPFEGRELTAKVRSLLRRIPVKPSESGEQYQFLEANGVRLSTAAREVVCDGQPVFTTTIEFEILAALIRAAGQPVSRDQLMDNLYNRKATAFDRSIDMHISHLRRKLPRGQSLIKTVRGAGYQFCLAGDSAGALTISNR